MKKEELVTRVGDVHPNRALGIYIQRDGDVVLLITQDEIPTGGIDTGDQRTRAARVEFCTSGGRSQHTRAALRNLMEAMEQDNAEYPIPQQF